MNIFLRSVDQFAVSPVNKMLDKADCDKRSLSPSPFSVVVRKEREGERSRKELDLRTTVLPSSRKRKRKIKTRRCFEVGHTLAITHEDKGVYPRGGHGGISPPVGLDHPGCQKVGGMENFLAF